MTDIKGAKTISFSIYKGGTGKTMVSASLASVWGEQVIATDLDVEEPNLHLFLRPDITGRIKAFMEIPVVDETKCTYCRTCADLCQFKAISVLGETILTFPEMCHGCGGCISICPEKAVSAGSRDLGEISWGRTDGADFLMGRLRVGEAMSPPLMRAVNHWMLCLPIIPREGFCISGISVMVQPQISQIPCIPFIIQVQKWILLKFA